MAGMESRPPAINLSPTAHLAHCLRGRVNHDYELDEPFDAFVN